MNKKIYKYPIITYHHFIPEEIENMTYKTTSAKFEKDIKSLIDAGYVSISLRNLYEYEQSRKQLPEKGFVLAIEDGYSSFYDIAFPILRKYNIHADVFVVTELMGMKKHPQYSNFIAHFGDEEAIYMEESGLVTIHPHGHKHSWNNTWEKDEVLHNCIESNNKIKSIKSDDFFCFAWHDEYVSQKNIDAVQCLNYKYNIVNVAILTEDLLNRRFIGSISVGYDSDVMNFINYYSEQIFKNTNIFKLNETTTNIINDSYSLFFDGYNRELRANEIKVYTVRALNQKNDLEVFVDKNNKIINYGFDGNSDIPESGYIISGRGQTINALLRATALCDRIIIQDDELIFVKSKEINPASLIVNNKKLDFERRAIWYRPVEKFEDEVRNTVKIISDLNMNVLFLESWYSGKFIGYSDNELIQHNEYMHGSFDVLEAFCRICHEYGIQLHLWTENFFIGTERDLFDNNNKLLNRFRDKLLIDKSGRNYSITGDGNFLFLNPYDSECKKFLIEFYKEIVNNYDIDGIHLDYIRFPEPNSNADFGYNEDIIEGFIKHLGKNVNIYNLQEKDKKEWDLFRQDIINSFVSDVYNSIKNINKKIWISCACFSDLINAPKRIYQNVSKWINNHWVDEVISMSYTIDHRYTKQNAKQFVYLCSDKVKYSIGISLMGYLPGFELAKQFIAAKESGADGIALFSLGYISYDNYYDTIKNILGNKSVRSEISI